jgi:NitT/TauT family transport system ATP-binding protein
MSPACRQTYCKTLLQNAGNLFNIGLLKNKRFKSETNVCIHPMTAAIEFHRVTKRFAGENGVLAVSDVSLRIATQEVVSIIGPSGCGKSTLLNIGAGLAKATSGEVLVGGEKVTGPNKHVAFMLQKDLLMPWRSIAQNIEFGLELRGIPAAQRTAISAKLIAQCRLSGFADSYPHQLSGGMRQRAALARTLAVDPDVLLMDEPFSALDAQTKMILQADLARTIADEGKTVLFITHDLVEAVALSDRILVMSERPGTIIDNIIVDLPDRNNPMQRRKHPEVGQYVGRLMELLKLDAQTQVH